MFTGIITHVGEVKEIRRDSGGARLTIHVEVSLEDVAIGASIAHAGCCLSVTEKSGNHYSVYASNETLNLTTLDGWKSGHKINLERALKVGDELGGHMVLGHVDAKAELTRILPDGESVRLYFRAPRPLHRFIAPKGSVTLDGVSLTVNGVEDDSFDVNLIPITWQITTLSQLKVGDRVNIEIDPLARYAARWEETR